MRRAPMFAGLGVAALLLAGLVVIVFTLTVLRIDAPGFFCCAMVPGIAGLVAWVVAVLLVQRKVIRVLLMPDGSDRVLLRFVDARFVEALQQHRAAATTAAPPAVEAVATEVVGAIQDGTPPPRPIPVAAPPREGPPARAAPGQYGRKLPGGALVAVASVLVVVLFLCIGVAVIFRVVSAVQWFANQPGRAQVAGGGAPAEQDRDVTPGTVVPNMPAEAPLPPELRDQPGVDLIPLFNPRKDTDHGRWLVAGGVLHCNDRSSVPRVQFPYLPPEEYDFVVTFGQPEARGVSLDLPKPGGSFFFWVAGGDGGTTCFFYASPLQRTTLAVPLKDRSIHTTKVAVRKDGLRGYMDGQEIVRRGAQYGDLTDDGWHKMFDSRFPAVACDDPTVFYHVRIIEVTGKGRKARE